MHASTARFYEGLREREKLSPKVRQALKLYASGAVNQGEAARAFGLNPNYLSLVKSHNEEAKRLVDDIDRQLTDDTVALSPLMQTIGREAISKIRTLMHGAEKEELQLKAAMDLADRNPETSKVQRHQALNPVIGPEEAKHLAASLVDAARVRALQEAAGIGDGDFVHAGDQSHKIESDAVPQLLLPGETDGNALGQVREVGSAPAG